MIDNFENLVERCNSIRRRRMIRTSLIIAATSISLVAIAAAFYLYTAGPENKNLLSTPLDNAPMTTLEHNHSETASSAAPSPTDENTSLPPKESSKIRTFVLQLTSSQSFDEVNASLNKIPIQHRPSLALYYVNNYYTLRYIDIYDRQSIPRIVAYFRSLGFKEPAIYKYNPLLIPINAPQGGQTPTPSSSTSAPAETVPSVSREQTRLFSVQTTPKNSTADLIQAFHKSPSYDIALRLANEFYTQGEFDDAALWSKKANQLNREAEEAWLLYAKSYYAQGKKAEAISVLELYLNYKDSRTASKLLRTWKQSDTGE